MLCPELRPYIQNIRGCIYLFLLLFLASPADARQSPVISGIVKSSTGESLPGANVSIKGTKSITRTNTAGLFYISSIAQKGILFVSFIGFQPMEIPYNLADSSFYAVTLKPNATDLSEVEVSTGFQRIPRERATGSFVQLDNALINRRVSSNILDRLDGIASGVLFNTNTSDSYERFNVRGRSTLLTNSLSAGAADPLIVLDNFPYDGDISNINPNDIESISILKDAAAASIWGARSANGVVVITTKKGKAGQPVKLEFNSNLTLGEKPDIFYRQSFLEASAYIDAERFLYEKGYFNSDISNSSTYPVISPAVQILSSTALSAQEKETRLNALRAQDVRRDYSKYFYQASANQQYSLALRGGAPQINYSLSAGYDHNRAELVRNSNERLTFTSLVSYHPLEKLEVNAGLLFAQTDNQNNNTTYYGTEAVGGKYNTLFPYASFADEQGNPLEITKGYGDAYKSMMQAKGFQDWSYRPLQELQLADNTNKLRDITLRAGLKYHIIQGLNLEALYQHQRYSATSRKLTDQDSYEVRNYVNRFSAINSAGVIAYNFPTGAILNQGLRESASYNLRAQVNYNFSIAAKHHFTGLAGIEMRENKSTGFERTYYGYNDEFGTSATNLDFKSTFTVNPSGSSMLPSPQSLVPGTLNRYISYFTNLSYTYENRYLLTASARQDGANIFGVKTNDKITPLWSLGLGWNISNEAFYHFSALPYLKLRATYGYNGNVYNASAFLTARYSGNNPLGLPYSLVTRPPNPELSWEKVRNINIGIDFASKSDVFSGSLEFFRKDGTDLISDIPLAPSLGFSSFRGNAASTRTSGFDLTLNTQNIRGKFNWKSSLLLSYATDKVIRYDQSYTNAVLTASYLIPVKGNSLYGVYSYRWAGLDGQNGDPIGYLGNQPSKDWNRIINNTPLDSLRYHGSAKPPLYGSLLNFFSYGKWSASVNILFRTGHYFRREATPLNYTEIISMPHKDFASRWQQAGDEAHSQIPSAVYPANSARSNFYRFSEQTVERADLIRLQDLTLNYQWKARIGFYFYANNLGLIWKATNTDLDPDFPNASHVNPRTFSFGIKATL